MLEINKLYLTNNNCYKSGKLHFPQGMMYHSTGANNKKLSRYVGPDDGILGVNPYGNHWNTPTPGGRSVCTHGFIGIDKDGIVRFYQTLPWEMVGWHSGSGSKGSANTMGILGVEICEDNLQDREYFFETINLMNQLTAYLAVKFGWTISPNTIMSHSEGWKKGIASNHGDIEHWARRYGYTMDMAREEVKRMASNSMRDDILLIRNTADKVLKEIDSGAQVSPVQPTPLPTSFKEGDKARIKKNATTYATGQTMASFVKGSVYTIQQIQADRALMSSIMSWVRLGDLERP